ncbi:MAG: FeoB-associated Cys-rich membrane protein [Sphingobacteriaceae bacterium]
MNLQSIIVVLLFAAAIFYIGRMLYRNLTSKKACGGCGKCAAADFSKVKTSALPK